MSTPPPRPALRRAADAAISPAMPARPPARQEHNATEPVDQQQPAGTGHREPDRQGKDTSKQGKGKKGKKGRKKAARAASYVDVTFPLTPRVLRRLDARADELGHSRERTLTLLVEAWLEG